MDPVRKALENGIGVMTVDILVIQPTSSPLSLRLSKDDSIHRRQNIRMYMCSSGTRSGNFSFPRKRKLADLAAVANLPTLGSHLAPHLAPDYPFEPKNASLASRLPGIASKGQGFSSRTSVADTVCRKSQVDSVEELRSKKMNLFDSQC